MSSAVEVAMRCHLAGLIDLAGDEIPAGVKRHPDVQRVPSENLRGLIDAYTTFLRRPR